jgi:hypothetical protein
VGWESDTGSKLVLFQLFMASVATSSISATLVWYPTYINTISPTWPWPSCSVKLIRTQKCGLIFQLLACNPAANEGSEGKL